MAPLYWPSLCTHAWTLVKAQRRQRGAGESNVLNMWPSRTLAPFSRAPNHMNQLLFISVDENSKAKQGKGREGKERRRKKRNEKKKKNRRQAVLKWPG